MRGTDLGPLQLAREATFDQYQRWSPRAFEDMPVRIVDIDEASLRALGQWPWPRDRLAMLVERLADMGASAIAFDILFAEPDRLSPRSVVRDVPGIDPALIDRLPDNDEIFAGAIAGKPVVLGFALSNEGDYRPPVKAGFAFTGESPFDAPPRLRGATPLLPRLQDNAAGLGHINLDPENLTGIIRTVPLFLSDGGQLYPNLSLEALRVAQGASTYLLAGATDVPDTITFAKIGEFTVPVTASGALWLHLSPDRPERYVSASDVLADGGPSPHVRDAIAGNIVFVGTSAAGLLDIRTTALGENVPGVSLHAQIVEQVLSGSFLSRPDWANGLEITFIAILGATLVTLTFFVSPAIALACGLLMTGCALVASWLAFAYLGMLFDPLAAIAAGVITHFATTSFRFLVTDRERRAIRQAFGQYLSPSLLYRVEHMRDALRLGGDDRELTVMFVDVRDFTAISERLAPAAVVDFLNTLFDALSRHVAANDGTLDKYIGDSIMAFWNAPLDVANHGEKAVRTALEMRETLARLNAEDAFGFAEKVGIGIGIHTGLACVGNLGAKNRFNYSAVGDAVNVSARIESACKAVSFDILVSEATAKLLAGYAVLQAGALKLKGKSSRTNVYAVVGDRSVGASAEFSGLQAVHAELVQALRSKSANRGRIVRAAKGRAAGLTVGLQDFYDRISRRADHFLDITAGTKADAAE